MPHDEQSEQATPIEPSSSGVRRANEKRPSAKPSVGRDQARRDGNRGGAAARPLKERPPKFDRTAVIHPAPWPPGTKPPFFQAIPCQATVDGTAGIPVSAEPAVAAELMEHLQTHGEITIHDCWNFVVRSGPDWPTPAA
jgi:hypothetical protein